MNNKYVNRSKISEAKFRQLVRFFALDLTATQMAELTNLNRNTINRYVKGIRERIAEYCYIIRPIVLREYPEANITDAIQTKVVGIMEDKGTIHTIQFDVKRAQKVYTLFTSGFINDIHEKLFPGIDMLVELETRHRLRLCDKRKDYSGTRTKVNRIEGFIGYSQTRLEKFKGIHSSTYILHLKECELRYNTKNKNLYSLILKIIRKKPLF